ncbi:uncharacterized protein LOC105381277 [Plutella xylostella]|uniref:uncharacterized protein LOC105381277 n=1 Tax=Plutella xylostella TaxID=51655 RepID=UPI0020322DE3|nr:uncharacterized protein LOC105381277 [Plutella xylostella]
MSQYYNVVPWFNSEEWCAVYEKLYSQPQSVTNKEFALNVLLIWKARCPSLPSGIESTLSLLEVHVEDLKADNGPRNHQVLRLAYSSAIMRFVNHMLDKETAKGSSLYQAAKNLDIPEWIIDLRHDTAHNNSLPSIELLREATDISLDWLLKNYWHKHKQHIKDYLANKEDIIIEDSKITTLMNFCLSLSICAHSQCDIKSLAQIKDKDMRESIISDVREVFGEGVDTSNVSALSVTALINMLNVNARRLLKGKNTRVHMNQALLGEDSLFLSLPFVELMGEKNAFKKNYLSKHFVQCFEVLLTFLHTNDLILDFILELVSKTKEDIEFEKKKLAAIWISEILKALKRSQEFLLKAQSNRNDLTHEKKKELASKYHHWFPNEKSCLLLNLQKGPPVELTDINFIQPIITSYNPYLTYFIKDLLNLLQKLLPRPTVNKICSLADMISNPDKFSTSLSKVYTVDDLQSAIENHPVAVEESDSDCVEIHEEVEENTEEPQLVPGGIWRLAPRAHSWFTTPIGLLPWQVNTPIESMDID